MEKRIWELDFLRGALLLGVFFFHFLDDLIYMFALVDLSEQVWQILSPISDVGAALFFALSGICVRFSRHPVKRGLLVLGGGLTVSLVTVGMYLLQFSDRNILIYFGVLHCIGSCMLLWPLFKKLPTWGVFVVCAAIIPAGLYLEGHLVADLPWLIPLGIYPPHFVSADYFPLLPYLGYFLLGTVAGRYLYPRRETLFPRVDPRSPFIRIFTFIGRRSLLFYLLHQPVLAGLIWLWTALI